MTIKTIGIVGAGQMGRGIAQVAALAEYMVILVDMSDELATSGKSNIAAALAKLEARGKLTHDAFEQALCRITTSGTLADLASCDIVIEAATENVALKLRLFAEIDAVAKPDAIIVSNTSSVSITLLAGATKRPHRVMGMHFMNPVPVMRLVELIRAMQTSDDTYATVKAFAEQLGKQVVTSKDCAGFIVNRVLLPLVNEAFFALFEGLGTREDIDAGAMLGLNHPMGPLALADFVGLDTCLAILEIMEREHGAKFRPCPLLRQYVAAGHLGKKTGRGVYDYPAA